MKNPNLLPQTIFYAKNTESISPVTMSLTIIIIIIITQHAFIMLPYMADQPAKLLLFIHMSKTANY